MRQTDSYNGSGNLEEHFNSLLCKMRKKITLISIQQICGESVLYFDGIANILLFFLSVGYLYKLYWRHIWTGRNRKQLFLLFQLFTVVRNYVRRRRPIKTVNSFYCAWTRIIFCCSKSANLLSAVKWFVQWAAFFTPFDQLPSLHAFIITLAEEFSFGNHRKVFFWFDIPVRYFAGNRHCHKQITQEWNIFGNRENN